MNDDNNEHKPILYLGGGTMSGVFGLGVVRKLAELDIYDNIGAIYAGSAGTMNGAAFVAKQTENALAGYTEGMIKGFIKAGNIPRAFLERLVWPWLKKRNMSHTDVVDIDYLFNHIRETRLLDFDAISRSTIPFYASLFDVDSGEFEFHDVREDPQAILRAATTLTPYYGGVQELKGRRYVDGALKYPTPLQYLLDKHPGRKIILVLNYWRWSMMKRIATYTEGIVAGRMFGGHIKRAFQESYATYHGALALARENDNVVLITPPEASVSSSGTTKAHHLLDTFEFGRQAAAKAISVFKENAKKHGDTLKRKMRKRSRARVARA